MCVRAHFLLDSVCPRAHSYAVKHITLSEAMARRDDLTQQDVEDASGVDRTWVAKLLVAPRPNPTLDTYDKLDAGLRKLGVLKRGERLVFGRRQERVAS